MHAEPKDNNSTKKIELFYRWKGLQIWALNLQVYKNSKKSKNDSKNHKKTAKIRILLQDFEYQRSDGSHSDVVTTIKKKTFIISYKNISAI